MGQLAFVFITKIKSLLYEIKVSEIFCDNLTFFKKNVGDFPFFIGFS